MLTIAARVNVKLRLLGDENFPFPVTLGLWAAGLDVLTADEAALLQAPDVSVLASATAIGRAVLMQDRDYVRLHKGGATQDDEFAALAVRVEAAIAGRTDLADQLIRVVKPNPPKVP